jgi:hypothetical protein
MKRLIVLALIALTVWYGWKHYPELLEKHEGHDAVIANQTGQEMDHIRLTVDGQTFVKEELQDGDTVTFKFRVANDATFHLEWEFANRMGIKSWDGGLVPRGPMLQRHIMTLDGDGEVLYQAENK